MKSPHVQRKWRPSLGLIVSAVFLTVLALPLAVTAMFRLFDNELVRQTERELIAQSAVIASITALEIEGRIAQDYPLGKERPDMTDARYNPTLARLDLTKDRLLPPRPDGRAQDQAVNAAVVEMGKRISRITLLTPPKRHSRDFGWLIRPEGCLRGAAKSASPWRMSRRVAEALEGRAQSVVRERSKEGPDPSLTSISRASNIRVFTALPVIVDDRVAAVVYASRTPQSLTKYIYNERSGLLLAAVTALLAAGVIGFVFLRTVNGPMHMLLKRTKALGDGDRNALAPLPRYGTRELAQLSEGIFTTAKQLFDRSDFVSTFAAHASHELKSPLTAIQGAAELMRDSEDRMPAEERNKFLNNIISDTDRLTRTVTQLREFARADNPQLGSSTTFDAVIAKLLETQQTVPLDCSGDMDVTFAMSTDNAAIVLSHLIFNAMRHGASMVTITVQRVGDKLTARVSDNGWGIPENIRDKIFDPFYTTERNAGGTGMGLAIVRTMLEAHGGSIDLIASQHGASFMIQVPRQRIGSR